MGQFEIKAAMTWQSTEMAVQIAATALRSACFLNAAKREGASPSQVRSARFLGNLIRAEQSHRTAAATPVRNPIQRSALTIVAEIIIALEASQYDA